MKILSIGRAWDETRETLVRDGNLFVAVAGALLVLPLTLLGLIVPESAPLTAQQPAGGGFFLMALMINLISIVAGLSFVHLALKPGSSVKEAIMDGLSLLFPVLGAILLWFVPVILLFITLFRISFGPNVFEIMAQAETNPAALEGLQLNGVGLIGILILGIIVIYAGLRLSLLNAVAVAERPGPIGMLKRSWALTKGHALRLFGFMLLFGIVIGVVFLVVQLIAGLVAALLGGQQPMSVGGLVFSLAMAVIQAAISVLFALMLANIYRQLAVTTGVPDVDAD